MVLKIDGRIVGMEITQNREEGAEIPSEAPPVPAQRSAEIIDMHERVERPPTLIGQTYKVKPPEHVSEHALYITVNNIVLNEGTEHELQRPFEIFINSKNMEHFQWIVALTRIVSAVFRKGGDVAFLAEELKSVFDPAGGYWKSGGKYMPSLVAEIGSVLEEHLVKIGLLERELDARQQEYLEAKRFELVGDDDGYPENSSLCARCNTKAVVLLDGCMTCLNCGDSKCQ